MVFVDTSALIAFMDSDDEFHNRSTRIFSKLINENSMLITTNYIMLEAIIILKGRFGLEAVESFNNNVMPSIKVYWINEEIHNIGVNNIIIANKIKVSLVDYTSFEVMKKLDIEKAFSFDNHFKSFGFDLI